MDFRRILALKKIGGAFVVAAVCAWAGCRSVTYAPAVPVPGDEIIVAGERFHTGTRVVTWMEADGYNGYAPPTPPLRRRFSSQTADHSSAAETRWELPALQRVVDQFVLHYDACGSSQICFQALHSRGLSVHFLLDSDGTVYQTLDLQERALHATIANERSIGIEIANIGAYPPGATELLDEWYPKTPDGAVELRIPARFKSLRTLTPNFKGRPARPSPVVGSVHHQQLTQFDFTPEQYTGLVKLTAALSRVFPKIRPVYPHRFLSREPIMGKLSDRRLVRYQGILGHFHIQENKVDPGPAFNWPRFAEEVRAQLNGTTPQLSAPFVRNSDPP